MKITSARSLLTARPDAAFTLIELLAVVAILILWLAVLLPVRAQTKERPQRITCLNNIKHWTTAVLMYADDNANALPQAHPGGGANGYWVNQTKFRDVFNQTYSIPRAEFYCPANPGWNRDEFWNWSNAGQDTVMGYSYFAGEPSFTNNAAVHRQVPPNRWATAFPMETTDIPYYPVLFADLARKIYSSWGQPGETNRGFNHYVSNQPLGANEGYLDGHAAWVKAKDPWIRYPKLFFGSTEIFVHGGEEHP